MTCLKWRSSTAIQNCRAEWYSALSSPPVANSGRVQVHLFRNKGAANLASEACDTVCVLAVPAYMSTADFLQHVGSHQSNIVHMRMIRNSVSKRFMVLIKFHSPAETALFHKEFNRQPFSSMAVGQL